MPPAMNTFVFICGLHRSGTSLLHGLLREHPQISGFRDTGVNHDEGQHLQSVYPRALGFGGPGVFGFNRASHLTESAPLVTEENRLKLFGEWAAHWDTGKPFLLEKSPPNLVRTRFLQAMFPNSRFLVIRRHPVAVALATREWSRTSLYSLVKHWVTCHEIWEADRPFVERFREVSYERLVEAPLETVNELCAFLGADPLGSILDVVDASVNQRYFAAWASLKRRLHLRPYLGFIERAFEARIGRWGYSFSSAQRTEWAKRAEHATAAARTNEDGVPAGRCLVIAGMHRSGTSLVAQAFSRAGLYMGDALKGATRFNPDGFFEDLDIVRFHDSLLALSGRTWHSPDGGRALTLPPSCRVDAHDLLRRKFDGQSLWGWKDPRTSLFLDFWKDILPAASYVLVFRRPAHVAWSLLVRGDLRVYSLKPVRQALIALRLWTLYNRELLRFARAHPEASLLLRVPADVEPANETRVSDVVIDRWGYRLRPIVLSEIYTPAYLKTGAPRWIEMLARLHLPARRVFHEMDELRMRLLRLHLGEEQAPDDARRQVARPFRSKHRVCIISPRKAAYSETFIQAHVKRLPATVKLLHGGHLPEFREDDRRLMSVAERGMNFVLEKGLHIQQARFRRAALRRYLDTEKIAVVLAEFGPAGAEVWEVCRAVGVPLVVHFHGADSSKPKWLRAYRQTYERMFTSVAGVIAASRDEERRLVVLGAPPEKVHYNPCGADTALFVPGDPSAAPPRFLFAGRFVDKKAPHLTLLAFRQVLDACPEARLTMIGDGALLEACRQLSRALRLGDAVAFPGVRAHAEVAGAMREARAVVQHSVTTAEHDVEGTPVAILEAGAAGLPVIATRHAGIADVVMHGETGFLVEEGDVDGMARHMIAVARDPALAGSLGRRARQHVAAHFSMEQSLTTLWTILENAIVKSSR